jgi:hypothetical protein
MNRDRRWKALGWLPLLAIVLSAWFTPSWGEGQQIHGENSSFLGQGVAMVWGVLRGVREEDTQVVLRVALAGGEYTTVSVDGVDPFTGTRRVLLPRRALDTLLDVRTSRATFADLPRREIHFYSKIEGQAQPAAVTVYFMGLPDTTPEFNSEAALLGYLNETLTRLMSGKGHRP